MNSSTPEQQSLIAFLRKQKEYNYIRYLSFLISTNNKAVSLISESVYTSLHNVVHDQTKLITSVVEAFTKDDGNLDN